MTAFLLFFIFSVPQEPKIISCVVTVPRQAITCDGHRLLDVTVLSAEQLDEWELVAPMQGESPNSDAPLSKHSLKKGDKVKLLVEADGMTPIANCKVRVWRKLKDYTLSHPGDRVPFTLRTEPDDCQPWYGKN